jgi:hypothetical protein
VGPSLQIPKKTVDKFAGSLIFWVGLSLQNPKKTVEKSEFQKFWQALPSNPKKPWKNPSLFENILVGLPLKNCGKLWKNPNFKICSLQENRRKIQISKPIPHALPQKFPNWQTLTSSSHFSSHLPQNKCETQLSVFQQSTAPKG